MESRPLGGTGLRVTPIGLGLAAVGRPAYLTASRTEDLGSDRSYRAMERRSHGLLDAAFAAGIRYFDVARSYGSAETFLGTWLEARPDVDVVVGSKWGYTYTGEWRMDADVHEVKDHSLDALRRQFGETRAILGARISLYQIHSATLESRVLEDRAVLTALAELASEGIVVGLTVSGPRQGDVIRRALERTGPFRSVQATWNVLEPSVGDALAEAHAAGWGVIVKEAVANGRLTDREAPEAVRRGARASVDQMAMAAVLAQPWCDVVLSGAATVAQLRSNIGALDVTEDLDELSGLAEAPEAYWAARSARPWT
jgi:aryl-alcohol dehydrogenase-like predicted oxidoreductase